MSRLRLQFDIETNEEGIKAYYETYPDFASESVADTFIREAEAQWDADRLIEGVDAAVLATPEEPDPRLEAAAQMAEALRGLDPDVTALDWLSALITDAGDALADGEWAVEDPLSWLECLGNLVQLKNAGRAALEAWEQAKEAQR